MAKTKKADFQTLADKRVREAELLLAGGEPDGAFYLAGYAVECALKACIIKKMNTSDEWPEKRFTEDCWKHDLKLLLKLADLEGPLKSNPAVDSKWVQVVDWSEHSRYDYGKTPADVRVFLDAITDPADGVLTWLKGVW